MASLSRQSSGYKITTILTFKSHKHNQQRRKYGPHNLGNLSTDDGSKEGMVSTCSKAADTARRHVICMHIRSTTLQSGWNVPHCMILFSESVETALQCFFVVSSAFCAGIRCSVDGRTWIFADRNFEISISFPQVSALSLRDIFKSIACPCRSLCVSCRDGLLDVSLV